MVPVFGAAQRLTVEWVIRTASRPTPTPPLGGLSMPNKPEGCGSAVLPAEVTFHVAPGPARMSFSLRSDPGNVASGHRPGRTRLLPAWSASSTLAPTGTLQVTSFPKIAAKLNRRPSHIVTCLERQPAGACPCLACGNQSYFHLKYSWWPTEGPAKHRDRTEAGWGSLTREVFSGKSLGSPRRTWQVTF